jgi:hypothetical protein
VPFELRLPTNLKQAGWKVKIREMESREPPHVTVLRRTNAWRINLRTGEFMDRQPDPGDVPANLLDHIHLEKNWKTLCDEWDRKYPANPVAEHEDTEKTTDDS